MKKTKNNSPAPDAGDNPHGVQKRQWAKWSGFSRAVFNRVYESMVSNQRLFTLPKAQQIPQDRWNTTAWNAARTAACETEDLRRETLGLVRACRR